METRTGIYSTEFWLSAVVAILGVVTPTLINFYGDETSLPEWARGASVIAGAVMSVFAALGYTVARSSVKKAELEAGARAEEASLEHAIATSDNEVKTAELEIRKLESENLVTGSIAGRDKGRAHLGLLGLRDMYHPVPQRD